MNRTALFVAALLLPLFISTESLAQNQPSRKEVKVLCDTLTARTQRRLGGYWKVETKDVRKTGQTLDFRFTDDLIYWPWHADDVKWFREELDKELDRLCGLRSGRIEARGLTLDELITPGLGRKGGFSSDYKYRQKDPRLSATNRFISRVGERRYAKGMTDRYISLWQSHGRFFNIKDSTWCWQRAPLHRTVEDMYTQSYVLPFLIPMLENAGAYVITPRERDTQRLEVVCDNDPAFDGPRSADMRQKGEYSEKGSWTEVADGFADALPSYSSTLNPFHMGTARMIRCSSEADASIRWTPCFAKRGTYAVYISYKTVPQACTAAHYTVHHLGGTTELHVNQRRGAGTWIYLGTFEFGEGKSGYVELDNGGHSGQFVSADAVRFGGGMGKVARAGELSGMPAYIEGALYSMIWAGVDSTMYKDWESDYTRDFASRGAWTCWMKNKGIPVDLSFAFHTDAGTTPNDSIVGTLAIYTLKADNKREFSNGKDRMSSRTYTDYVQSQVVNDLRREFDPKWSRRMLWDKNYSESRTTDVPAMLLELLSHQNFADMKYGLDPAFRFTVSRAVYKGMLKFLGELYGCGYAVQPLPVHDFSARLSGNTAVLSWAPTEDEAEPTAVPAGYTVYTRVDGGAFGPGRDVDGTSVVLPVEPGHVYSYKVEAWNDGGKSFPSEILSVGIAQQSVGKVLVVNNFDRVAAPTWAESPGYAGFEGRIDSGVPYISDISYIGENYEFRRSLRWETDDNPGHGASFTNRASDIIAGNTFDYPYVHGCSLMELGYSFESCSHGAFEQPGADSLYASCGILDLICGKQVTTMVGNGRVPARHAVFPEALQQALKAWTSAGRNVIISGANIATDVWSRIYPIADPLPEATKTFVSTVLGYKYASTFGTSEGVFKGARKVSLPPIHFHTSLNTECYCVECPGGMDPADGNGRTWVRYPGSNISAGVVYRPGNYTVVSLGVPIECICTKEERTAVLSQCVQFL